MTIDDYFKGLKSERIELLDTIEKEYGLHIRKIFDSYWHERFAEKFKWTVLHDIHDDLLVWEYANHYTKEFYLTLLGDYYEV